MLTLPDTDAWGAPRALLPPRLGDRPLTSSGAADPAAGPPTEEHTCS